MHVLEQAFGNDETKFQSGAIPQTFCIYSQQTWTMCEQVQTICEQCADSFSIVHSLWLNSGAVYAILVPELCLSFSQKLSSVSECVRTDTQGLLTVHFSGLNYLNIHRFGEEVIKCNALPK